MTDFVGASRHRQTTGSCIRQPRISNKPSEPEVTRSTTAGGASASRKREMTTGRVRMRRAFVLVVQPVS